MLFITVYGTKKRGREAAFFFGHFQHQKNKLRENKIRVLIACFPLRKARGNIIIIISIIIIIVIIITTIIIIIGVTIIIIINIIVIFVLLLLLVLVLLLLLFLIIQK